MSVGQILANVFLFLIAMILLIVSNIEHDYSERPRFELKIRRRLWIIAAIFGLIPVSNLFITAIIG